MAAAVTDFTDACEKYSAGDVTKWWTSGSCGVGVNDYSPTLAAMTAPSTLLKTGLTANISRLVIIRFKTGNSAPGSTTNIIRFQSAGNLAGSLAINASNQLLWRDSAGGSQTTPGATTALTTNTWYVVEAGYLMGSTTTGRLELRINGVQIAAATSSADLGGAVGTLPSSTSGGFTNCDAFSLDNASGALAIVDFVITRTNTTVWAGSDWMADSTATPPLKKKTIAMLQGTAGNGQYQPNGTTFTIGAEPLSPPNTSQTDAIRTLPFPGTDAPGTGYLSIVEPVVHDGIVDRDSLFLEAPPTDIFSVKTVSVIMATRFTVGQYDFRAMMVRQTGGSVGTVESGGSAYSSLITYRGVTWCLDQCTTNTPTAWTPALLTNLEIGQHSLAVS